jgi:hypothetical protein
MGKEEVPSRRKEEKLYFCETKRTKVIGLTGLIRKELVIDIGNG